MKNIYHVFTANRLHLVPQIIRGFYEKVNSVNHVFILWKCDDRNRNVYLSLKEEIGIEEMYFAFSLKELESFLPSKSVIIILHSINLEYTFFLLKNKYVNVNGVFWGSGIRLNNLKNYLFYPIKFLLYHQFKTIVTLMQPDKISLQNNYGLKNVKLIPYIGERELILRTDIFNDFIDGNIIYIGNNSSCLASYLKLSKGVLWRFRQVANIRFMLNYDLSYSEEYHKLLIFCKKYYNSSKLDTDFYNIKEYIDYMNKCSIYICGEDRQTGLGAIYTLLNLGKKIFLQGNNYLWIKSLGCHIYHIDDIKKMSYQQLISPLNLRHKKENRNIIRKFENTDCKIDMWNEYLKSL